MLFSFLSVVWMKSTRYRYKRATVTTIIGVFYRTDVCQMIARVVDELELLTIVAPHTECIILVCHNVAFLVWLRLVVAFLAE